MNDAYFSHDVNARNDPKTAALIQERGMVGYGCFWVTVEMLRAQSGFRLPNTQMTWLALSRQMSSDKLVVSPDDVKEFVVACVETYELLEADEKSFWSPSLLRRMAKMDAVSKVRRRAGLASAAKSWLGDETVPSKAVQHELDICSTDVLKQKQKQKEKGGKEYLLPEPIENGKTKYRDKVTLDPNDYERLVNAYGKWFTERCLDKLDAWKGAKGRTTKSDYKAILLWVVGAINEDINRGRIVKPKEAPTGGKYSDLA